MNLRNAPTPNSPPSSGGWIQSVSEWWSKRSKQTKDSVKWSASIIGFLATILTISGYSLSGWTQLGFLANLALVFVMLLCTCGVVYLIIGRLFRDSIELKVGCNRVSVRYGNLFDCDGWRVIGCDSTFSPVVDDKVISKNSLHGQLIAEHANVSEIRKLVEAEAKKQGLQKGERGYDFPLGTVIPYESDKDGRHYLLVAMTKLDENYKSKTTMAEYENMLMTMWEQLDKYYASYPIFLPLMGGGITRFEGGKPETKLLLGCMLCTLNGSGMQFNTHITIVLSPTLQGLALYEYSNVYRMIPRRT